MMRIVFLNRLNPAEDIFKIGNIWFQSLDAQVRLEAFTISATGYCGLLFC